MGKVAVNSHCICTGSDDRDNQEHNSIGKSHQRQNRVLHFGTDLIHTAPTRRCIDRRQNLFKKKKLVINSIHTAPTQRCIDHQQNLLRTRNWSIIRFTLLQLDTAFTPAKPI